MIKNRYGEIKKLLNSSCKFKTGDRYLGKGYWSSFYFYSKEYNINYIYSSGWFDNIYEDILQYFTYDKSCLYFKNKEDLRLLDKKALSFNITNLFKNGDSGYIKVYAFKAPESGQGKEEEFFHLKSNINKDSKELLNNYIKNNKKRLPSHYTGFVYNASLFLRDILIQCLTINNFKFKSYKELDTYMNNEHKREIHEQNTKDYLFKTKDGMRSNKKLKNRYIIHTSDIYNGGAGYTIEKITGKYCINKGTVYYEVITDRGVELNGELDKSIWDSIVRGNKHERPLYNNFTGKNDLFMTWITTNKPTDLEKYNAE